MGGFLFLKMKEITINTLLIENAIENGELKQLAVFIKLKSLFSNGCIYNYSYNRLSYISGISINVLKQCINFFKQKGWCSVHGKNLVFNKINKVDCGFQKRLEKLVLIKKESYRDVIKRLKLIAVKSISNKFEYIKKVSRDYNNPTKSENHKAAKRRVRKFGLRPINENVDFSVSNYRIGKAIGGKSKSTASRLMKWACGKELVKLKTNIVNAFSLSEEQKNRLDSRIVRSNKLNSFFVQFPNSVVFL